MIKILNTTQEHKKFIEVHDLPSDLLDDLDYIIIPEPKDDETIFDAEQIADRLAVCCFEKVKDFYFCYHS